VFYAAARGHLDILRYLVGERNVSPRFAFSDISKEPLVLCAFNYTDDHRRRLKMLDYLLEQPGVLDDARGLMSRLAYEADTELSVRVAAFLLDKGVNGSARSAEDGKNALQEVRSLRMTT
jgi:hypothetical protein